MKIDRLAIAGPDDEVDHFQLKAFQDRWPFVEWGILFSGNQGKPRYPSNTWINQAVKINLNMAAHFCGWWSREVLVKQNFNLITALPPCFKRVQLNFNFERSKGWNLVPVPHYAQKHPDRDIILQYNRSNAETIQKFLTNGLPPNIHILFDASGGRGTEITNIQDPVGIQYTGYAGGINTENIVRITKMVMSLGGDDCSYIDLESGARTDDRFDTEKVWAMLTAIEPLILK